MYASTAATYSAVASLSSLNSARPFFRFDGSEAWHACNAFFAAVILLWAASMNRVGMNVQSFPNSLSGGHTSL